MENEKITIIGYDGLVRTFNNRDEYIEYLETAREEHRALMEELGL